MEGILTCRRVLSMSLFLLCCSVVAGSTNRSDWIGSDRIDRCVETAGVPPHVDVGQAESDGGAEEEVRHSRDPALAHQHQKEGGRALNPAGTEGSRHRLVSLSWFVPLPPFPPSLSLCLCMYMFCVLFLVSALASILFA